MTNWEKELVWLPAGDPRNPFPFASLDCRAAMSSFHSLTRRETGSATFSAIEELIADTPPDLALANPVNGPCSIAVKAPDPIPDATDLARVGAGHKWLLQSTPSVVLARRRWTGQLIHVGEYTRDGDSLTITRLASERTWVFEDFDYAVAEMEFLLRSLLEHASAAFPAPPAVDVSETAKIALHGWKAHGPLAQFARKALKIAQR